MPVCTNLVTPEETELHCHQGLLAHGRADVQVRILKQEIKQLRETVLSLEGARPTGPSQAPTPQPLFNTLSLTEIAASSIAQQRSQAVASPATPSHAGPWGNSAPSSSMGSSEASTSLGRGSEAQTSEVDSTVQQSGNIQHALDPLLLEAENVMTNPMFGMDAQGASVPATPKSPAPQLLQAVALQQVRPTCQLWAL